MRIPLPFLFVLGCSAASSKATGDGSFPEQALVTATSQQGSLEVEVRTAPTQPPARGSQSVELVVRRADSRDPVAGLTLDVQPWMPAMGHGASVRPEVTETAPGTYVLDGVNFYMPGTWELRTKISGPLTDALVASFYVP